MEFRRVLFRSWDNQTGGVLAFVEPSVPYLQVLRMILTVRDEVGFCFRGTNGIYIIPNLASIMYGENEGGWCCGLYRTRVFEGEFSWRYSQNSWWRPSKLEKLEPWAKTKECDIGGKERKGSEGEARKKTTERSGLDSFFAHNQGAKNRCERFVFMAEDSSKWGDSAKVLSTLMEKGKFGWVEIMRGPSEGESKTLRIDI
jgi:hypothetical protein